MGDRVWMLKYNVCKVSVFKLITVFVLLYLCFMSMPQGRIYLTTPDISLLLPLPELLLLQSPLHSWILPSGTVFAFLFIHSWIERKQQSASHVSDDLISLPFKTLLNLCFLHWNHLFLHQETWASLQSLGGYMSELWNICFFPALLLRNKTSRCWAPYLVSFWHAYSYLIFTRFSVHQ